MVGLALFGPTRTFEVAALFSRVDLAQMAKGIGLGVWAAVGMFQRSAAGGILLD